MTTNNNSLEKCLLVPRETVGFKEVKGIVDKIDSSAKIKPVILTDEPSPDFLGFKSGGRSGLLSLDSVVYKIKGCNIKPAFETEAAYTTTYRWNEEPVGGQLLADSKREIEFTHHINELLTTEGFPVPYEPSAIIRFGKFFQIDPTNSRWYPLNLLKEAFIGKEELAASVMRIKGDTRLPEIYGLKVQNEKAAFEIAYKFGLMAGAQKRVTENKIFWSFQNTNTHVGNYVVFEEKGDIYLGMVDLDDAAKYSPIKNRLAVFDPLIGVTLKEQEIGTILSSLNSTISSMIGGINQGCAPQYFKNGFIGGFREGYKNADKREPITHADLHAVFKFK